MQSGWLQQFMRSKTTDDAAPDNPRPSATPASGVSRRAFMQSGLAAGVAAGSVAAGTQLAQAQTPPAAGATPIGPKWWPSKWGPQDEAGASNHMTPAKVLAAAKLIKTGKVYNLDHVYEAGIPLFGSRVFALRIPGTPSGGPFGKSKLCYHDEFVATEIGQVGT
jgi:hypothetical protein